MTTTVLDQDPDVAFFDKFKPKTGTNPELQQRLDVLKQRHRELTGKELTDVNKASDQLLAEHGLHRPDGKTIQINPNSNVDPLDFDPDVASIKAPTSVKQALGLSAQQQPDQGNEMVGNALQKAFDLKKKMQGLAASGADVIAGAPSMLASTAGYLVPRALSGVSHLIHKVTGGPENLLTPEETQAAANRVAAPLSQPVGKLTGMAETPEYKQALPSQVMDYIGSHINEGAEAIAKRTGVPVQDIQAAINGLMLAAPLGVKGVSKATKPWMQELEVSREAKAKNKSIFAQPETTTQPLSLQNTQQFAPQPTAQPTAQATPIAAPIENIAPQEKLTAQTSMPDAVASPPVSNGVQPQIAKAKSDVLTRLGFAPEEQRISAVTGDALNSAIDANLSKFIDHPLGKEAYEHLANERQKLSDFNNNLIKETGSSVIGNDQSSLTSKGKTIDAPIKKFNEWFDSQTGSLYKQADEKSGGLPVVNPADIEALLNDREFNNTANAKDQQNLVKAIKDQLQLYKDTNPDGLTVKNTEQFRKWLNTIWNKDNSSLLGKVKEQIDDSVLKHAGEDTYKQGRDLWKLKKETLEDPKGIAKLFDYDINAPINRRTPFQNIANDVINLDSEQFGHIIKTLDSVPPELKADSQKAKSVLQGHYLENLMEKGSTNKKKWNEKNVSNFRKAHKANEEILFKDRPDLLQKLDDLEAGGHILDYDPSYIGAAAQAQSAIKRGILPAMIQKGSTAVGGAAGGTAGSIFGPIGTAVGAGGGAGLGEMIGGKLTSGMESKAAKTDWAKRTLLSEIGKQP